MDINLSFEEGGEKIKKAVDARLERGIPQVKMVGAFKTFRNIVHFISDPEGLALNTIWNFNRQYEYIAKFYSLFCPNCNDPGPNPSSPFDCWGRSPLQLQEDILFELNEAGFYECPKCGLFQKDSGLPSYREMVGVCGMRCVAGDTWVLTQEGMTQLITQPVTVWNTGGLNPATEFIPQGTKSTIEVITSFGFRLRCSPNHPILVVDPGPLHRKRKHIYKEASTLCVKKDHCVLPIGQNIFGKTHLEPEEASFLGVLIGDGCISGNSPYDYVFKISGNTKEPETLAWIKRFHPRGSTCLNSTKTGWSYEFSDVAYAKRVASLGYNRHWKAPTKEVPSSILTGDRDTIISFLRGVFETDGCTSTDCVNHTTVSPILAKQIQLLLLNLGIVSSLSSSPTRKFKSSGITGNRTYTNKIKGRQWILRFSQIVGFLTSPKNELLQKIILSPQAKTKYRIRKATWGEYILVTVRHVKECSPEPLYDIHVPNGNSYWSNGLISHNSGKTMLAAQILLYELHCDLLIDNPQKTWGLAPGQEIYYTVATTKGEQAKDTIFAAIDGLFINSPWFIRYVNALKTNAHQQNVPVDNVYVKNLSEIRFLHRQLFVDLTGSNSAGIAGKTRKICVVDEVARFTETDSRMGVDAVYDTLKASLLTLSKFGSKMICISSPMTKIDKIMRLKEDAVKSIEEAKAKGKESSILVFTHSTWDFNPNIKFEDPFIQDEFRKNPVAAKRDFGADPPGALDPWMPDDWRIDECIDSEIPNLVFARDYVHSLIVKGKQTNMVAKDLKSMILDVPTTKHIAIGCDPGHRMDSFGMILAYVRAVRTARGIEEHLFVGAVLPWEPKEKPLIEVDFRNVLQCIFKFSKHWVLDKVVYDQWQSVLQIQDLQAAGIDAEKIPLKKEDWDMLAALFYNRQIHLLHPLVGGHGANRLVWELKNLQIKESGKVDHSPLSSSDLAVCLCRLAKVLVSADIGQNRALEQRSSSFGKAVSFRRP